MAALVFGLTTSANSADLIVTGASSRDYVPVAPARILDTRTGLGSAGPIGAGQSLELQVAGTASVPAEGVAAVVLNVTVTEPSASSFLTVYPSDQARPLASNLNFVAGATVPNLVIAKLSATGRVRMYNNAGSAHVIADVMGWFPVGSSYQAQSPVRILDTRSGVGAPAARVGPNSDIDVQVAGVAGVPPSGVTAVVLNVTATEPSAAGWVAVYPSQSSVPSASSLNFVPAQTIANVVITGLGPDGKVRLHNNAGTVDLLADVQGWFSSPSSYHPLVPNRVLDTRSGLGSGSVNPVAARSAVRVKVTGTPGVPATGVGAVVLNVTVTEPTSPSWLAAYASGSNLPGVSNLNFLSGQTVPNLVFAKVGVDGTVSFFNNSGTAHVVADVQGWFPSLPNGIVSAGGDGTCFVRDGAVLCAGLDNTVYAPSRDLNANGAAVHSMFGLTNAVSVSTQRNRTCAVLSDRTLKCWGFLEAFHATPVTIPISQVEQVATGDVTNCALRSDGTVWCWGVDSTGSFGTASAPALGPWVSTPVQVPGLSGVTQLAGFGSEFCGANNLGVYCWGNYVYPASGSAFVRPLTLEAPVGRVTSVAVGDDFACASLPSGQVGCWGIGTSGTG